MVPIVASLLVGVAVKVGVGLLATAAKKLLDAGSSGEGPAATPPQSFPRVLSGQLQASSIHAMTGAPPMTTASPGAADLPASVAFEDRLRALALENQMQRIGISPKPPVRTALRAYVRVHES